MPARQQAAPSCTTLEGYPRVCYLSYRGMLSRLPRVSVSIRIVCTSVLGIDCLQVLYGDAQSIYVPCDDMTHIINSRQQAGACFVAWCFEMPQLLLVWYGANSAIMQS